MKNREYNEEKLDGAEIAVRGGFLGWLDNYWYHYKWITVGVAFALIVLIICTVQMCGKEKDDLVILYAGRNQLSAAEAEDICSVFEAVCPEDFDGNGEKELGLSAYYILSETQINDMIKDTSAAGEAVYIDKSYNSSQYDTYYSYLQTGDSSVLLLDPWLYSELESGGRLAELEGVLGYAPDGAVGKYGVRLGDTALYEQYAVLKLLPEDTVICILKPYVIGKNSKEEYYAYEKKMLKALVSFGE